MLDRLRRVLSGYLSLPRMLDRLRRVLSGYDPVGWLGLPMDFMNSTGVLRPIEECGRT
jgi:hypothetical protein